MEESESNSSKEKNVIVPKLSEQIQEVKSKTKMHANGLTDIIDVYINESNSKKAEYICSTSKLRGNNSSKPIVESKICSRFK